MYTEVKSLHRVERVIWGVVYFLFIRFSPYFLYKYRNFIYRAFGAQISSGVEIYPTAKIWLPKNLVVGQNSGIGPGCELYNVDKIIIGEKVNISQDVYICTASHMRDENFTLIGSPVFIGDGCWVAAKASILPGVKLANDSVIGACSVVSNRVKEPGTYIGNPAVRIK